MLPSIPRDRTTLILAAILILGLFLRTHCLACESLWLDEGYTINWVMQGPAGIINSAASDVHPPMYFMLLYLWAGLLGNSEFALRFFSVVFSVLSIVMIHRTAALVADKKTGLLSALLFAVSTFHLYFSQEARVYSLMVFLAITSMYLFLRLPESKRPVTIAYVLASILVIYTHYFGAFIIIAQNAYVLYGRMAGKNHHVPMRRWVLLQCLLVLSVLPWVALLAYQFLGSGATGVASGWIPLPSLQLLTETLFQYSGYYYLYPWGYGTSYFDFMNALSAALSILVLILAAKPFISVKGRRISIAPGQRDEKAFLLIWLSVPLLLPFVVSYLITPIFWARYTAVASPAFYILASMGIRSVKSRRAASLILLAILALSLTNACRYHHETNKEQWREAAGLIDSEGKPGDLILLYKGFAVNGPLDYYLEGSFDIQGFPAQGEEVGDRELAELEEVARSHDRIWLVLSHHIYSYDGTEQRIIETIERTHFQIRHDELFAIETYLFEI